ncbi:MAG: tetratricopeptide repeat protein [Longimicrobiales bacterium]
MNDIEAVLSEALALGEDGRWEEMAALLATALETSPDDPYLLCWAGVAEQELGNDAAAYDLFRRCIDLDPLDAHLLALAGAGLAHFDDPEAETALRTAALTAPNLPLARIQYGAYLAREGLFEDALEHLHAGVSLSPEDPVAHGELGTALALKGDHEGAASAFENALDLAPDDSWTRVLLGLVYAELERHEDSAEMLNQAAKDRSDDAEALVLAALSAASMGWDDAAEEALARAEYAVDGADARMLEEAAERVHSGADAARAFLMEAVAPAALHDRLTQAP